MTTPQSYPLTWPKFRPRTPRDKQMMGRFTHNKKPISIPAASERLEMEVERLSATHLTISSNVRPTLSGRPSHNGGRPDDVGVAIYFMLQGDPITLACDTFDDVAQNLAGLAGHIEATRRQERYGVQSAKETLQAFAALPSPTSRTWRDILGAKAGMPVDKDWINERRRALLRRHHPDRGGDGALAAEINAAADKALSELAQ